MIKSILKLIYSNIKFYIKNNMYFISVVIRIVSPFILIDIAAKGTYNIYVLFAAEAIIELICYLVRSISNYIGKGESIPVPLERFTEVHEDGEVRVNKSRINEMILYVSDVEDYLERKGIL